MVNGIMAKKIIWVMFTGVLVVLYGCEPAAKSTEDQLLEKSVGQSTFFISILTTPHLVLQTHTQRQASMHDIYTRKPYCFYAVTPLYLA